MTLKDIFLFQFGVRGAIERAARTKALPIIGALLALITSIPRNYDQTLIFEQPWWPLFPLLFSFVSGSLIYLVLRKGFISEALSAGEGRSGKFYWQFLGLFWMTSPIAWLYALPVERVMTVRGATIANLCLLGIVAIWRIALLTRAMVVTLKPHWVRAACWVIIAAAAEMFGIVVLGGFGAAGQRIGRAMGGMRNSPEENLILETLGVVFWIFVVMFILSVFLLRRFNFDDEVEEPPARSGRFQDIPALGIGLLALGWCGIALHPQRELRNEYHYVQLIAADRHGDALEFLNSLAETDWPPAKPFRPHAFDYEVWHDLPPLFAAATGNEQPWVRTRLLDAYENTFLHRYRHFSAPQELQMLTAIEHFPEGSSRIAQWNERHHAILLRATDVHDPMLLHATDNTNEASFLELANWLKRHGIVQTNTSAESTAK